MPARSLIPDILRFLASNPNCTANEVACGINEDLRCVRNYLIRLAKQGHLIREEDERYVYNKNDELQRRIVAIYSIEPYRG